MEHEKDPPPCGLLFLVTAPSGAGKDSVIQILRETGVDMTWVTTAVTRPPRPGEKHGVDHFFLTESEFDTWLASGSFLETATVYGRRYGTPINQVRDPLLAGQDVMVRLDVQGAIELKRRYPASISIFLKPPTVEEAERRMRLRQTETSAEIKLRVEAMQDYEMSFADRADHCVVSSTDDLCEVAGRVWSIVKAARCEPARESVAASLTPVRVCV